MTNKKNNITQIEAELLAVKTLMQLIETKSLSREEENAATIIEDILKQFGYQINRKGNNIWAYCKDYTDQKETLMLNSHIDTVKPGIGWETDPFEAVLINGKLSGLGSNDAGASLVSLLMTFLLSEGTGLSYNRLFVASAEEEISGKGGMESILPELKNVSAAIIGEPTQMEMAIAEKGLLVLDCEVKGKSGHAARTGGINAITEAVKEIEWFHSFEFPQTSKVLGPVKMTVTVINAGKQHNVIPDTCTFVVDVRTNEKYTNQEAFELIQKNTKAKVKPRSLRLNSSGIANDHPLVIAAKKLDIVTFGSPTTSDQSVITQFPTIKMGPGDSNRSHTANEYIMVDEIKDGITAYTKLLNALVW